MKKNLMIFLILILFSFDLTAQTGSSLSKPFKLKKEIKTAKLNCNIEPKELNIPAGEIRSMKLTITNSGQATAKNIYSTLEYNVKNNGRALEKVQYKLSKNYGWSDANNILKIDVDSIPPGLKKEIEIDIKALEDALTRDFQFIFKFINGPWGELQPLSFSLKTNEAILPAYSFSYSVIDTLGIDIRGNNNGRIDPGETIELITKIKNTGNGVAKNVKAIFSLNQDENNLIIKGETNNIVVGDINSKTEKIIKILITISEKFNKEKILLNLELSDQRKIFNIIQPITLSVSQMTANIPKPPSLSLSIEPEEIELEPDESKIIKLIISNSGGEKASDVVLRLEPKTTLTGINYDKIINAGEILPGIKKEFEIKFQSARDAKSQNCEFQVKVTEKKDLMLNRVYSRLKA